MSKKQTKVIAVQSPKLGKSYSFLHAGYMPKNGILVEEYKDLTKQYGYKWYKFSVPLSQHEAEKLSRTHMFYPVSIFDIVKELK